MDFQANIAKILLRDISNEAITNAKAIKSETMHNLGLGHTVALTGLTGTDTNWFG